MKVRKTFSLKVETVKILERLAKEYDLTPADVVDRAIRVTNRRGKDMLLVKELPKTY